MSYVECFLPYRNSQVKPLHMYLLLVWLPGKHKYLQTSILNQGNVWLRILVCPDFGMGN